MRKLDVVIATLMRPSLRDTLASVRIQTVPDVAIKPMVRYDPEISEYASRDLAIKDSDADYIAIIDDDAYYEGDVMSRVVPELESFGFIDGVVRGNIFGRGVETFDHPYLGIGTALFMTREAYDRTGGFRLDWGTDPHCGWRMDTALEYEFLKRNKGQGYKHMPDVIINHPNPMQSQWSPRIEWMFYREYQHYVEKYILPLDGRLPDMIKHADILDLAVKHLGGRMDDIILAYHKGIILPQAYNELRLALKGKGVNA